MKGTPMASGLELLNRIKSPTVSQGDVIDTLEFLLKFSIGVAGDIERLGNRVRDLEREMENIELRIRDAAVGANQAPPA
jgi:hypothetical protein